MQDEHDDQPVEDSVIEEPAVEEHSVESLTLMLEDARAKADDHWDQFMRTQAELENLRKRNARDVENARKFGLEPMAKELLHICDSMELGISAAGEATAVASLQEGMELTLKMLTGLFEKFDIQSIDPDGEKFDPEQHQAMSMQPAPGIEAGTVLTVFQKGYSLNGRLIRPAMVIVASAAPAAAEESDDKA